MKIIKTLSLFSMFLTPSCLGTTKLAPVNTSGKNYKSEVVEKYKIIHLYAKQMKDNYIACNLDSKKIEKTTYMLEGVIKGYELLTFVDETSFKKIADATEDWIEDLKKESDKVKKENPCWKVEINPNDIKEIKEK